MSIITVGTLLKVGTGSGTPETFNTVGEVLSFNGPSGNVNMLDVTNLSSTEKEMAPALYDAGNFSFELNCNFGDTGQTNMRAAMLAKTKRNFQIVVPAGASGNASGAAASPATTASFAGYVGSFSIQGGVDGLVKASATVRVSGTVAYA